MNQLSKTYLDDLRATVAMPPMSDAALEPIGAGDEAEILAPDGQEKAIGERLAQARKAAKLSRTTIAKAIGRRGAQAVTDYETGTSKVRLSTVRQIAAATGADVTWLWLGREPTVRGAQAGLSAIADNLDRLNAEIDNILLDPEGALDSGPGAAALKAWWDLAKSVQDHPVTCAGDVVALARICRSLWAQTLDSDDCDLRDALDQKLQQAVIAQASASDPDAALIALCAQHAAAIAAAKQIGGIPDLSDAASAEMDRLNQAASDMEPAITALRATTPEGVVALARSTAAWAEGLLIDNDSDALLKMLLRDSLALGTAQPVPTHPDAELLALHDRFIALEANSRGLNTTIADDDARAKAHDPLDKEQGEILEKAWELTATTLEGYRARARMLLAWDSEIKRAAYEREDLNAEMLWLLVRDLLGAGHADALQSNDASVYEQAINAGQSGVVPSPDDEIIELCKQAEAAQIESSQMHDEMDGLSFVEERLFDKEKVQPAYDKACEAYDRIVQAPLPLTAEGLRAAARAAIFHSSDPRQPGPHKVDTSAIGSELAWKLVGHLAGLEVCPMMGAA